MLLFPLEISAQTLCDVGRLAGCNANRSVETEIKALLCHALCVVLSNSERSAVTELVLAYTSAVRPASSTQQLRETSMSQGLLAV